MNMKLTLGKKLGMGFATVLALMIISAVLAYQKSSRIKDIETEILTVRIPTIQHLGILADRLDYVGNKTRHTILAGTEPERREVAQRSYDKGWASIDNEIAKLDELAPQMAPENRDRFTQVKQGLPDIRNAMQHTISTAESGARDAVIQGGNEYADKVTPVVDATTKVLGDLMNGVDAVLDGQEKELASAHSSLNLTMGITTLLGLAIGSLVAFWISRAISSSTSQVLARAQAISDGDLTGQDLPTSSNDELGDLARAINGMQNSLRETITSVSSGAERIATASEELSASASQQAAGAETQKDQTHQVATAMQEMSSTVQQVSENSNKASEASRKAADTARQGGSIVEDTLAKMRAIADSVGQTAKKVQELGKSSNQIGEIIGVIDDIADQTNLLALNAAIEAARAGEQGRGFAVVADEVRKLAERTSKATKEITQMIQSIQTETKSAVEAMESGTKQVELGVESTTQAGTSLHEIIKTSEQVGDMVMLIATAATEQASASDEINGNIEQIAKITQETAAGAGESAKAIHELSNLATDLQSLVSKFKTGDHSGRPSGRRSKPAARPRNGVKARIQEEEYEHEMAGV
ncbi:MAG: methyl-accepting chemotaxis protein [Candidatus Acidiferrales bacterium]